MKGLGSLSYAWVLQTLASAESPCSTLETICFKQNFAELWVRPDKDGNLFPDPLYEKPNIRQVFEQLMCVLPPQCYCLCYTGSEITQKTLKDAKAWVERKKLTQKIEMIQVLPCDYQHRRTHCLDLRYINCAYQCKYTIREDSHVFECNNDRWFRKLKDVSTRTIKAIESASSQRLLRASFSFLVHEGEIRLLTISQVFMMSEQRFLAFVLETTRKETVNPNGRPQSKAGIQRIKELSPVFIHRQLASPLRIHTPAFTTPSSPREDSKTRFPAVTPRPAEFFSYNFKEMVAKTIQKEKTQGHLTHQEKSIGEVVKDDEAFFALVGVGDEDLARDNKMMPLAYEQVGSPMSCKTAVLLKTFSEQSLSTVSTITPPSHLTKKSPLFRLLKPLKKWSPQQTKH